MLSIRVETRELKKFGKQLQVVIDGLETTEDSVTLYLNRVIASVAQLIIERIGTLHPKGESMVKRTLVTGAPVPPNSVELIIQGVQLPDDPINLWDAWEFGAYFREVTKEQLDKPMVFQKNDSGEIIYTWHRDEFAITKYKGLVAMIIDSITMQAFQVATAAVLDATGKHIDQTFKKSGISHSPMSGKILREAGISDAYLASLGVEKTFINPSGGGVVLRGRSSFISQPAKVKNIRLK